ncbi:hypothetical protein ICJ54_24945 [Pseudomonas asiatica]|uniref:hypothetical protein n=1 Tax=Pseudomonas TaxID=286 RepID=UPI00156FA33E|nr:MULTISPECIES: hypothetical protein [Pseudomonas]MDD2077019.1 hypothetical protein [Pseudomonas putida]QKL04059.1 hypothetical protein GEV39_23020 [Pseudomonas sp. NY5710]QNT40640.1 hypothetical protein ICJ54_24945 [Pseudomonas asiatica]HDS1693558.1 hypothetical protein [Pseudomonas putida]
MQAPQLILANHQDAVKIAVDRLNKLWKVRDRSPLFMLRSIISSPRLADVYVKGFCPDGLRRVADSYLCDHTLLGDLPQATFGIELSSWRSLNLPTLLPNEIRNHHTDIIRLQIWPFDPNSLSEEQMRLAVAVSFTDLEFFEESRLSGSVDYLLEAFKIDSEFNYRARRSELV